MTEIDWDSLTFSLTETDWMYVTKCSLGGTWVPGKIEPYVTSQNLKNDSICGIENYYRQPIKTH